MSKQYRSEMKEIESDARWTFWKVLPLFLMVIVLLSVIGFTTRSCSLLGNTIVEREVFENSYQRSEALKSSMSIFRAQRMAIESKLLNPNLDENTKFNLEAQLSAIEVREHALREQMK